MATFAPMRSKLNAQPNQSLIDGMRVVQALAMSEEPIGCRELGRQLGFEATKVNRLLRTLAYLGISQQTANRKYTAGPGMQVLAARSLFTSGLLRRALPALERLRRFGHTVALGVLWNDSVSYLFHAPPGLDAAQAVGRIGLLPATESSIGMVLLAELDDSDVTAIFDGRQIPHVPGGLPELFTRLARVRSDGYARLPVVNDPSRTTMAVALRSPTPMGLALSGWIPDVIAPELVSALRDGAREIAEAEFNR